MSEFEARYKTWRKKNQCIPIIFSLRVIKGVQAKQKERKKTTEDNTETESQMVMNI